MRKQQQWNPVHGVVAKAVSFPSLACAALAPKRESRAQIPFLPNRITHHTTKHSIPLRYTWRTWHRLRRSTMTSLPPARCCTLGSLHEGEAKGEIRDIGKSKRRPVCVPVRREPGHAMHAQPQPDLVPLTMVFC